MPARIALAVLLAACWDAWRLLTGRIEDGASIATMLVLVAGLGWRLWRMKADARVPAPLLAGLLGVSGA